MSERFPQSEYVIPESQGWKKTIESIEDLPIQKTLEEAQREFGLRVHDGEAIVKAAEPTLVEAEAFKDEIAPLKEKFEAAEEETKRRLQLLEKRERDFSAGFADAVASGSLTEKDFLKEKRRLQRLAETSETEEHFLKAASEGLSADFHAKDFYAAHRAKKAHEKTEQHRDSVSKELTLTEQSPAERMLFAARERYHAAEEDLKRELTPFIEWTGRNVKSLLKEANEMIKEFLEDDPSINKKTFAKIVQAKNVIFAKPQADVMYRLFKARKTYDEALRKVAKESAARLEKQKEAMPTRDTLPDSLVA